MFQGISVVDKMIFFFKSLLPLSLCVLTAESNACDLKMIGLHWAITQFGVKEGQTANLY